MNKIKVTIWNEFFHEKTDAKVKEIYPNGIHEHLKNVLASDDFEIRTAYLEQDEEHGLSEEVLNETDVLIWWGHCRHHDVKDHVVDRVCKRVLDGMGFLPIHSAHICKPFCKLMGTECSLRWRELENEHCRIWTVAPSHPITHNVPISFVLDHEEMYGEPFQIPTPDELIFITWWRGGEIFRGGCTYKRQNGKIFYFHPGHETCKSYYNENVIQILKNAIRWAKPAMKRDNKENGNWKAPDENI